MSAARDHMRVSPTKKKLTPNRHSPFALYSCTNSKDWNICVITKQPVEYTVCGWDSPTFHCGNILFIHYGLFWNAIFPCVRVCLCLCVCAFFFALCFCVSFMPRVPGYYWFPFETPFTPCDSHSVATHTHTHTVDIALYCSRRWRKW